MSESSITNTFTWTIPAFDVVLAEKGLSNVVKVIHWRYMINSSDGMSLEIYGTVGLGDPDSATFVSYDQITQELAEQWLSDALNVSELQDNLISQLQAQRAPAIVTQAPPFAPDPIVIATV
jgi:hypothetical protein